MREEKRLLVEEIKDHVEKYGSFLIMSYRGLASTENHELRTLVRNTGGNVEFVPKRMLVIAADEVGVKLDRNALAGHIGLVFGGEDPLVTTKVVYDFRKGNKDAIEVIGGHIDGNLYSAEQMEALSKLPGKDELRAQFLGLLEAPMAQTVSTMNALVSSIVYCLDNKIKNEEGQ